MRVPILLLPIVAMVLTQCQQPNPVTFQKEVFVGSSGSCLPYRILWPEDYDSGEKYPLVLFLHGAGERGDDNESQLLHGSSLFLDPVNRKKKPAIVVFPQCPSQLTWYKKLPLPDTPSELTEEELSQPNILVQELLDHLIENAKVDTDRVYVMGLSMGGFGTFHIVSQRPELFAAAIPICGGGDTALVANYAHVPFWIFHGAEDDVVPVERSRVMVDALRRAAGNVKYTEYPEVDHNSWDPAFAEEGLLDWLFNQKKIIASHKE